jgi:hypothetical protein
MATHNEISRFYNSRLGQEAALNSTTRPARRAEAVTSSGVLLTAHEPVVCQGSKG